MKRSKISEPGSRTEVSALLEHPEAGNWLAALLLTKPAKAPQDWPLENHIAVVDSAYRIWHADLSIRPPLIVDGHLHPFNETRDSVPPDLGLVILNGIFGAMNVRGAVGLNRNNCVRALESTVGASVTWNFSADFGKNEDCPAIEFENGVSVSFGTPIPRAGSIQDRASEWADRVVSARLARMIFEHAISAEAARANQIGENCHA